MTSEVETSTKSGEDEKQEESAPTELNAEQLRTLRRTVESIFSKDQILLDTVLQMNMDPELTVLVQIVAVHPKVVAASGTVERVIAVAKESPKLNLDEETQRIGPKPTRTTLIMRDFPEEISQSDVQELLNSSAQSADVCSIRGDHNSMLKVTTYFVTMDTEESTLNLALWLKGKKIKDAEIKASVKSEAFNDLLKEAVKNTQHMMQHQLAAQFMHMQIQQQQMQMYQNAMAAQMAATPKAKAKSGSQKLEKNKNGSRSQTFPASPKNQKKASQSTPLRSKTAPALGKSEPGFDTDAEAKASRRYTRSEIIAICKRMNKVDAPSAFKAAGEEQKLLRSEPILTFELEKALEE